mgnify:CR=1 FL=1
MLGTRPGQPFFIRSLRPFTFEDSFELRVEFALNTETTAKPSREEGLLLFQLSTQPVSLEKPASFLLQGLVVALFQAADGPATLSHRFFADEVRMSAHGLAELFRESEGCAISAMSAVEGLRVRVDLPEALRVEHRGGGAWQPCFEVAHPLRYLSNPGTLHLSLQTLLPAKGGQVLSLRGIEAWEKPHALDVDAALLVSHGLVEEIFEKVRDTGSRLEKGHEGLRSVSSALSGFATRTARLEVYAHDLSQGTALFQAAVMAAFAAQNALAPADLPQLRRVKEAVDRLEETHGRVFTRLTEIKRLLRVRDSLRKAGEGLARATRKLQELKELSAQPEFARMIEQSSSVVEALGGIDVEGVVAQLREMEVSALEKHTRTGIAAAAVMALMILGGAFFVARRITLAEKRMFL